MESKFIRRIGFALLALAMIGLSGCFGEHYGQPYGYGPAFGYTPSYAPGYAYAPDYAYVPPPRYQRFDGREERFEHHEEHFGHGHWDHDRR